jgi:DNA polymerase/3'-5' exonuclease PolX
VISNKDVLRTLERIADLLEIRGENVYAVRADRQVAAQVENLGAPRELDAIEVRGSAASTVEAR